MATHQTRAFSSKRPTHARPSKPAPLSKRSSSHGAARQVAHHTQDESEEEESMATSFLNYCCRNKDNDKQTYHSEPMAPFTNFSYDDFQFRDIVTPRSPTAPSKRSSVALSEMSSDDHAALGDEGLKRESEASRYLRQFQSATTAAEITVRPFRPRYSRASTTNATFSAAPSLSHTPNSSLSYSMPYTPSTRLLPPRTKSSSYAARSTDLVTPFVYATAPSTPPQYSLKSAPVSTTSTGNVEGEILYEKSPIPSMSSVNSSLKQLFAATPRWS